MGSKPRDMSGTAYCLNCGAPAEHERGPGSPLSITHADDCARAWPSGTTIAGRLGIHELIDEWSETDLLDVICCCVGALEGLDARRVVRMANDLLTLDLHR